ncbi:hypothetical protein HAZT_HAZT008940, partial [Hyalella azteca]
VFNKSNSGGSTEAGNGAYGSESEDPIVRALETCRTNHQFIASQAEHLQRLRSQCATSAPITRQEIRALEVKLVRLFGQQLACKRRLLVHQIPDELNAFPCLKQWLSVVGLTPEAVQAVCHGISTLEELLALGETGIATLLGPVMGASGQTNKLQRALHNLRRYTASLMNNSSGSNSSESDVPLYWDSWDHHQQRGSCPSSPRTLHRSTPHTPHREARSSVSSSDGDTSDMGSSASGYCGGGGGSSFSSSSGTVNHHHHGGAYHHHRHHRSSDESSTPSSPPVTGLSHHHSSSTNPNNASPNIPPPSPLHPPSTPSLTLQLPPSSTPHDLRYTPPTTPPVIKTPKPPDKKVSTPPPNKKYLLINPPSSTSGSIGRSTSHESQLTTREGSDSGISYNTNYSTASNTLSSVSSNAHNANDLHMISPKTSAVAYHMRHQSESSGEVPLHPALAAAVERTFNSSASVASPTRQHYTHQHPYHHQYSDDDNCNKNASVPRSPRTPPLQGSMVHNVQHRFTKSINIKPATCGYCHQKFPILGGLRCKECNFKCHRECESSVPPSCGLPHEYLKIFTESVNSHLQNSSRAGGLSGVSPSHQPSDNLRTPPLLPPHHHTQHQHHSCQGVESSSNTSSCNSSTPSSPALLPPVSPAVPSGSGKLHRPPQQHTPLSSVTTHEAFHYPDVTKQHRMPESWVNFPHRGPSATASAASTIHSLTSTTSSTLSATSSTRSELIDSDRTTVSTNSGSGSTDDSERTVAERVDSQDSTISDGLIDSVGGVGSVGDGGSVGGGAGGSYGSGSISGIMSNEGCSRQNSVSQGLREWHIPYDELDKGQVIGHGRFGTVYSGNWHGQVAIKELHMEHGNDQCTLEAFKREVSTFRKTRHQNLVLFMGACMKLPRLAIITSLCKGSTLYKHIHILKDKFTLSVTINIAQQVAQGMGYLHAKGIVHKDLKTKNIFYENGKVVITDFGLVNLTRLCRNARVGSWLSIPAGWLCYLSPELMRSLQASSPQPAALPHTTWTDVYAYGTVWFELLCNEWPHKGLPPEAIIWQVGRGIKPSLAHLQASRDVKDILMECWAYKPEDRPDFASLQKLLDKLPKKKLARSPSHPIHLSRSAECVF